MSFWEPGALPEHPFALPSMIARFAGRLFCAALVAAAGCAGPPDEVHVSGDECGDLRAELRSAPVARVYGGTLLPSHVPLAPGDRLAIGDLGVCSGALIAPTWVLTAAHCGFSGGDQFCVGSDPASADICALSVRADHHPDVDLTLLELERDLRELASGVAPVAIMTEAMGPAWVGRTAEAAGYGNNDVTGGAGTRYFVAEPIIEVTESLVTVDGAGLTGLCSGDSGGPLLVIASDSTVRVAGALSFGDSSCRDRDSFARVDTRRAWIEARTGPTVVTGCGAVGAIGRCSGGEALWCAGGALQREPCLPGAGCGWDDAAGGFRCIAGPDPCAGLDIVGECDGAIARWCDGEPRSRDCARCGMECRALPTGVDCF